MSGPDMRGPLLAAVLAEIPGITARITTMISETSATLVDLRAARAALPECTELDPLIATYERVLAALDLQKVN